MTNEEAIKVLESGSEFANYPHTAKMLDEACQIAVKAIKTLIDLGYSKDAFGIGDTVYQIDDASVYESKIKRIIFDTDGVAFDSRAIGHSIFLTRDDAEKMLFEKGESHEA